MRVFAKYFTEIGIEYRKNTLMQFGDKWDLIGSLFLINPGSAMPIENQNIENGTLQKLIELTNESKDDWFVFNPDPTMRYIEALFSKKYINQTKSLNGVILLFNLFNLRDPNLKNAIIKLNANHKNKHLISYEKDLELIKDKPVYLGWGVEGKTNKFLSEISVRIFESVKCENKYLKEKYYDNTFYHPRYIQMCSKKPHLQALLNNFSENTQKFKAEDFGEYVKSISNSSFKTAVVSLVDELNNDGEILFTKYSIDRMKIIEQNSIISNSEFKLGFISTKHEDLEITISSKETAGYISVRALHKGANNDWNSELKEKSFYISTLNDLNFLPYKSIWLGKIKASDIGYEKTEYEETNESIKKEIMLLVGTVISEL